MISLFSRRLLLSAGGLASLVLSSVPAYAQALALPALPAGCLYTENSSQPLTSSVNISAETPPFSEIGAVPHALLSIGVKCHGPLDQDVSVGVSDAGTLAWSGPARDVLATDAKGIGVRLFAEAQSQGGQCRAQGTLSAGNGAECRISREGEGERSFHFALKAQLIKTDKNTPMQSNRSLRLANGGTLLLNAQGVTQSALDILNSGLLAPGITTTASCKLETPRDHNINFGSIYRPTSGDEEVTLAQQPLSLAVSCLPEYDNSVNPYNVVVTFSAGEVMPGDDTAMLTNIDDMSIRFSDKSTGNSWLKFGEKQNLEAFQDAGYNGTLFSKIYYWHLRYLPKESHSQSGNLTAVATYVIEVH